MTDMKCSECGYTMPTDATKCPIFSYKYDEAITRWDQRTTVTALGSAILATRLNASFMEDSHDSQFGGSGDQMPVLLMPGADGYMIDCNGVQSGYCFSFRF
jgi:RNA polymerase subunit RPABC4/transcription elongation factor Spt4